MWYVNFRWCSCFITWRSISTSFTFLKCGLTSLKRYSCFGMLWMIHCSDTCRYISHLQLYFTFVHVNTQILHGLELPVIGNAIKFLYVSYALTHLLWHGGDIARSCTFSWRQLHGVRDKPHRSFSRDPMFKFLGARRRIALIELC